MNTWDTLFDAPERQFKARFHVYFDGADAVATILTSEDYVIDYQTIEEAWDTTASVLGGPEPGTLDLTLLNTDNRFTPTNADGPYAGKIVTGLKIVGELQVTALSTTSDWLPIGTFYVTEWKAPIGTAEATVQASDELHNVLEANPVAVEVVENITYGEFIAYYFGKISKAVEIDDLLGSILQFGWSDEDVANDLETILNASRACCFCNRTAIPHVQAMCKVRTVRKQLTDASEQFVSASDDSTIVQSYGGVKLTYGKPSLEEDTSVISTRDLEIPVGTTTLDALSFTSDPVYAIQNVGCQTKESQVVLNRYTYTPHELTITVTNSTEAELLTDVLARGTVVKFNDTVISDETDDLFEFSSKLLQTSVYANSFMTFLNTFISSKTPLLELEITGNIQYSLMDRIKLNSEKYKVAFDGVIVRIESEYNGGFSQKLTLMAYNILSI